MFHLYIKLQTNFKMVIKNNVNIVGISVIAIQRINLLSTLRFRKDITYQKR